MYAYMRWRVATVVVAKDNPGLVLSTLESGLYRGTITPDPIGKLLLSKCGGQGGF